MARAQDLTVGERIGDWIVVEKRNDLLRLSAPQAFPVSATLIGITCLIGGIVLLVAASRKYHGDLPAGWAATSGWLIILGLALSLVDLKRLGLSYTFDGCNRAVTRRRIIGARQWSADAFESVHVAVTHHGSNEIVRLVLIGGRPGTSVFVAAAPSDDRGLPLIRAAAHIAKILQLPPTRSGTSTREA